MPARIDVVKLDVRLANALAPYLILTELRADPTNLYRLKGRLKAKYGLSYNVSSLYPLIREFLDLGYLTTVIEVTSKNRLAKTLYITSEGSLIRARMRARVKSLLKQLIYEPKISLVS